MTRKFKLAFYKSTSTYLKDEIINIVKEWMISGILIKLLE